MDDPLKKIRSVVDACTDCDICRFLMDTSCLVFPEIYRLWDREKETGQVISSTELRRLVDLCTFCALCPCPNIRADIMAAKTGFVQQEGLKPEIRLVEDVALLGKICGCLPQVTNRLFRNPPVGGTLKRLMGIHPQRGLPEFPRQRFATWARQRGLHRRPRAHAGPKVAYFSGCTANYLFPEVGKSVVRLLQANKVAVWYPPQQCCGMPTYLEGDRNRSLHFAGSNLAQLSRAVEHGYDIVCSCPTCGFMLKNLLKEGAYYSREYQLAAGMESDVIKLPQRPGSKLPQEREWRRLKKSIYRDILQDDGYFADLPAMQRIRVAEHTVDLGQYLNRIHKNRRLTVARGPISGRMVYFAPCHQREQNMGQPYPELLRAIPGLTIESIDGSLYCCGMAGIMGFKRDFHDNAILLGKPLMERIHEQQPDAIITDCLSCKLQFTQLAPCDVFHPVELLHPA
jgi:glycerol-3-phosphate dehydrogenase subunit C